MKNRCSFLIIALVSLVVPVTAQDDWDPGGDPGYCYYDRGLCWDTAGYNPQCNDAPDPSPVADPGSRVCTSPFRVDDEIERNTDRFCAPEANNNWMMRCGKGVMGNPCIRLQQNSCETMYTRVYENGVLISQFCICVQTNPIGSPIGRGLYHTVVEGSSVCVDNF